MEILEISISSWNKKKKKNHNKKMISVRPKPFKGNLKCPVLVCYPMIYIHLWPIVVIMHLEEELFGSAARPTPITMICISSGPSWYGMAVVVMGFEMRDEKMI